jgi:type I restriction-modification system DNA methylase subunit
MTDQQTQQSILAALAGFATKPLAEAATVFFETLGYKSQRTLALHSLPELQQLLDQNGALTEQNALLSRWKSVDFLFQLTGSELAGDDRQGLLLDDASDFAVKEVKSYIFFAVDLKHRHGDEPPTRTELSSISRALNRLLPMPVLVLFRHGPSISIAIINRRKNIRNGTRDVLTRVSLIRNIDCREPHRAHLDLLERFSLHHLCQAGTIRTFAQLDDAWQKILSVQELNKRFYRELVNWFTWAVGEIKLARLPDHTPDNAPNRAHATEEFTVRLVCRTLFAWFLKEMRLIPLELLELYDTADRRRVLTAYATDRAFLDGNHYYRGILQNIFFQALNQPMAQRRKSGPAAANDRTVTKPELKKLAYLGKNQLPEDFNYDLFDRIPYLNGGLFDILPEDNASDTIEDGALRVPNKLFYARNEDGYTIAAGTGRRRAARPVEGINRIFDRYRFTVAENTPLEEDVALDPELLGLVFENLLAEIDPEDEAAAESARKACGSYYTPRRIVDYMVNEALHLHLRTQFEKGGASRDDIQLLSRLCYEPAYDADFSSVADRVVDALDAVRVLDPACGSGAFPMGMLHRMVELLGRVDPDNERWKKKLLARLPAEMRADAKRGMAGKSYNYLRKLGLIQKNLYGLDIQPLASLIAKLRFFLTLVIEQEVNPADRAHNYGLQALPNLETNLICCNTLRDAEHGLLSGPVLAELRAAREEYYQPGTTRERRDAIAAEIGKKLATLYPGFAQATKNIIPRDNRQRYEQDSFWLAEWFKHATLAAPFFNVETFFPELVGEGVTGHPAPFHIIIGNPPYGGTKIPDEVQDALGLGSKDPYGAFIARFMGSAHRSSPLAEDGVLTYIVSDTFMTIKTHWPLRELLMEHRVHKMIRVSGDTFKAVVNCAVILCQRGAASEEHICQMADLTNVSIWEQHERFLHLLYQTEGFARRQNVANQTYAIYHYRQSLIRTNSNLPFFVASPKLFALVNDVTAPVLHERIAGKNVPVRTVELNGRNVRLVKLSDIAEVVGGVKTYDNLKYVRSAEGSGRYDHVPEAVIVRRALTEREKEFGIVIRSASTPRYLEFDKSGEMVSDDGRLLHYYKPPEFYIDWSEEAVAFFAANNGLRNKHRYFQSGITYSVTGMYAPTFRVGCGQVFGQKGATIFCELLSQFDLMGQLCSRGCRFLIKNFLSHGVDATDSVIEQTPVLMNPVEGLSPLVEQLVTNLRNDPSYDYATNEQQEIDRLVYEAYGLNEADIREVKDWYVRRYPKPAATERHALAAKQGKTEEQLTVRTTLHLYCDESRHLPHDREPLLLLGMLACPADRARSLNRELTEIWKAHGQPPHFEAKWTKVSPAKLDFYRAVLDWFIAADDVAFRCLALPDKQRLYAALPVETRDYLYYRLYFHLLRSAVEPENRYRIFLDLKDTRGRKKLAELKTRLADDADDMCAVESMQHVHSHEIRLLQITDLLLGAVGFARRAPAAQESPAKRALVRLLEEKLGHPLIADSPPGAPKAVIVTWHDPDALLL